MEKITSLNDYKIFGVFLSGGLDSALLAYLTLELLPESKIVLLTGTHKHLDYYNIAYAKEIASWLDKKFPSRIIDHSISYYDNREDAQQRKKAVNQQLIKQYNIDVLLTGMTLNPISNPKLMVEGRDTRRDSPVSYKNKYLNIDHYMPFNNIDKKGIKELYKQYNVLDLAKLTISCESETTPKPCKKCWWCREKYWAFKFY